MEEAPFPVADEHDPEGHGKKRYWVPLEHSSAASSLPVPGWLWHIVFLFLVSAFVAVALVTVHVRNHPPSILFQAGRSKRRVRVVQETKPPESAAVKIADDQKGVEKKETMKTEKITVERSKKHVEPATGQAFVIKNSRPVQQMSENQAPQKTISMEKVERIDTLDKIRQDPSRIYLDNQFTMGELVFALRNLSPQYGVELYVKNSEDTRKTYYFPKVLIGKQEAVFEGTVLAPGSSLYGYATVSGLKSGMTVNVEFSAVGAGSRKEKVKLKW